ncbi:hypothetical protein [Nocardioides montaniterrae]
MVSTILKTRSALRRARDRWIDQTLVQVAHARSALIAGEVDVLVLGDSSCLAWARTDTDRTSIPEMVAARTGARVVTVAGGGYSAPVYAGILRLLAEVAERPRAVITTACIRTSTAAHVRQHPIHGHARSLAAMEKLSGSKPIRAFAQGGSTWREEELAAFRALEVTTRWSGSATVGSHLARIENQPEPWPVEVELARYDYFHGEVLDRSNPELASVDLLGRRLEEYGVPVAAYWVTPPVEHGERLYAGFGDHVRANLEVLESTLDLPGRGLPGLIHPELELADFQDARNGTEHFSFSGRTKIADAVVAALEPALA